MLSFEKIVVKALRVFFLTHPVY